MWIASFCAYTILAEFLHRELLSVTLTKVLGVCQTTQSLADNAKHRDYLRALIAWSCDYFLIK